MSTFENSRLYTPSFTGEMRLPPRASVIPALHKNVYYRNKEESELITNLNGDYKFCYRERDDIKAFETVDFHDGTWDTLPVPSMWQYHGYSLPLYPNIEYPIPFDPPYVGSKNPVGYYRKKFTAAKGGKKILYFGGVDSAFFVYLNGAYVGFSKGSRLPSEFDVTDFIRDGENLLCVKVFTYSDGTYLENQDMLLASGIFRDVFLYNLDDTFLWDYSVRTENSFVYVEVHLNGKDFHNTELILELDGQKAVLNADEFLSYTFEINNFISWNAEEPFTYELSLSLIKNGKLLEVHTKKFGFANYEVIGNKLMLNGKQITLKGINRHEHDPKNGRAITVERIERELKIIKDHNMNAIRCSHYPNNPAFYEYATELGIYVMNEADIETHGAHVCGDMGYFSKLPEWYPAFIDRVARMYERDKNETCISIWTIGNENGEGENIDKCIEYLRTRSVKKPVMHTAAGKTDPLTGDFRGEGYFTMESLISHSEEGKPVMLLEYGHAMGNSPGLMEDTWDYVYTHRHICGGYVWEFKNHGFYAEDENGNAFYQYGGDFGDFNHWSNFSMDGYCLSDGTVKPSLRDCKNVLAPTYIQTEGNLITLMNTNDFRELDYITLKWELLEDYHVIKSGEYQLPPVKPYEKTILDIDTTIETVTAGATYYANLRFYGEQGEEIAFKQVTLPIKAQKEKFSPEKINAAITEEEDLITVNGQNFTANFKDGLLAFYQINGKTLISSPMKLNIYRAPTDNDGVVNWSERWITRWNSRLYKHFEFNCHNTSVSKESDHILMKAQGIWAPISKYLGFDTEITYKIFEKGEILINIHAAPYGSFEETLPRIGVCFEMNKALNRVLWYGRGEDENYSDRKAHCNIGLYEKDVSEMNFIYDIPQECGTRIDNRFAAVTNGNHGFSVIGSDNFTFSYHDFSLDDLISARHRNELKKSDKNYLYIDYIMRGLGSHSCGPNPEECYELRPHEFRFVFMISGSTEEKELLALSRKDFGEKTARLSDSYTFEVKKVHQSVVECNINN